MVDQIPFIPSPNYSKRPTGVQPGGVVLHTTAGGSYTSTIGWFANTIQAPASLGSGFVVRNGKKYYASQASAHYVVGRKGEVAQMVDEADAAWHAGSRETVPAMNGKSNLNAWTIGIEVCNWGPLYLHTDGKFYTELAAWTNPYYGPTPVEKPTWYQAVVQTPRSFTHKNGTAVFPNGVVTYWEPITPEQFQATCELIKGIKARHPQITNDWIQGHEKVDPSRKLDPGPLWDWATMFNFVGQP